MEQMNEKTYHVTFRGKRKESVIRPHEWTVSIHAANGEEAQVKVREEYDVFRMHSVHEFIEPDNRFDPYWEALRKGE